VLSAAPLALVSLHRAPLFAAQTGFARADQRDRVVLLELLDLRPGEPKVDLGAPMPSRTALKLELKALDAGRSSIERGLGAGSTTYGIGQLPLEHPTLDAQLVDVRVLVRLALPVCPHAFGLTCPLPRSARSLPFFAVSGR
jgi:hypothetical protein